MEVGSNFLYDLPIPARGVGPFTLYVDGATPPEFEIFLEEGKFSGSADTAGVYNFAFTVEDALLRRVTLAWQFIVTVNGELPPPPPEPTTSLPAEETVIRPPVPVPAAVSTASAGSGGGGGAFSALDIAILLSLWLGRVLVGAVRWLRRRRNRFQLLPLSP
jgi:hypothetical protein